MSRPKQSWLILFGIGFAVTIGVWVARLGHPPAVYVTAAVACLCGFWWLTEPIPIPATSLIPFALFPLTNVLSPVQVAAAYGDAVVLLMLGGFMLSKALERSGVHQRLALGLVHAVGSEGGHRLVLGFMAASALLSMWISNAATVVMLLPIAAAVVRQTTDRELKIVLLLGIAYAASIGGIATPIGTPPNLIFLRIYGPFGDDPGFVGWMSWTAPMVFVMFPFTWWWLTRRLPTGRSLQLPAVGAWRPAEIRTLAVFVVTALGWMTRSQPAGGWSTWLQVPQANDASVALLAVVVLFVLPNGEGERLLDWPAAARIPWDVLILFGGGIALAQAFQESGLSELLGTALAGVAQLPRLVTMLLICLFITFLTEVTSNTATATLVMPILAAAAVTAGCDPRQLMVPATISASFAFMLPVATPPNAIVFAADSELTVRRMAREGLMLNLVGALVVSLVCYVLFP